MSFKTLAVQNLLKTYKAQMPYINATNKNRMYYGFPSNNGKGIKTDF